MRYYSPGSNSFYDDQINVTIPPDSVSLLDSYYVELLNGMSSGKKLTADSNGNPILQDPPEPTLQETQDAISARIQNTIDTLAKSWGYDNIVSAISYLSSSNKQYAADATALNTWRDAVWTWAFQNFPSITAGQDVNAFLANIPAAPSKPTVSG